jgi:cytidylate kinase
VIAIDGPAGAGKGTAARRLAERLGYRLVDTGAMYRAVAWSVAAAGLAPEDTPALRRHLGDLALTLDGDRVRVNGRDVTDEIRTLEIGALTSRLTALGVVRDAVTPLQRRAAAAGGVVLEGRDTGTVVCPDAVVKFYLDAALDERARRRQAELAARGVTLPFDEVRGQIAARDHQDTTRALAPLRRAPDALVVDTTHLGADEVVERLAAEVARRRAAVPPSRLYAVVKPLAALLMRLLFRVEVRGVEHVPAHGGVLLAANHSSLLDPPVIGGFVPRQLIFLAKAELFAVPGFGALLRRLNAWPLQRELPNAGALRAALRALERGAALLVFPEGSRGEEGTLRPGKPGSGMLAVLSGAPVVPVYVSGTGRAWPTGRRFPRPGKVRVTFGPPLRFGAPPGAGPADKKALYEGASQEMMAAIARLRDTTHGARAGAGETAHAVAARGTGVGDARRTSQIH